MALGSQVPAANAGANTNSNAQPKPATASVKAGNTTYNIQYYPAPQGSAPTLVNPNQTYAGVIQTQYGNVSIEYKAQIVQQSSGYAIALSPYQVASNQPNLTRTVNANTLSFKGISNLSGTITEQLQPSISGGNILFNLVGASGNVSGTLSTQYGGVGLNYSVSASNNQINLTPTGIVSNQQNLTATVNANTLSFKGISNLSGTITEQLQPTLSNGNIQFNIVSASGNITGTQSTQYGGVGLNYSVSLSNNQLNLTPTGIVSNQPNLTRTVNANTLSFTGISNLSGTITEQLQPTLSGTNVAFNVVGISSSNLTGTMTEPLANTNGGSTVNIGVSLSASLSPNNTISLLVTGLTNPTGTHTFSDFRQRQVYAANIPFYAVTSIYPNNLIVNPTKETEYFYASQGQLMSDVIIKQPVLVTSGENVSGGVNIFGANIGGTITAATANLWVRYSSRTNTYSFINNDAYMVMNNGNYDVATFFGNQQNFTYQINKQTGKISAIKYLTVGNLPFTITPTEIAITGVAIGAGIVTGGLADVGLAAVGISGIASSVISGAASFTAMNVTSGELSSLVGTGKLQTPKAVATEAVIGAVEGAAFGGALDIISSLISKATTKVVSATTVSQTATTETGSTAVKIANTPDWILNAGKSDITGLTSETTGQVITKSTVKSGLLGKTTDYLSSTDISASNVELSDNTVISQLNKAVTTTAKVNSSGITDLTEGIKSTQEGGLSIAKPLAGGSQFTPQEIVNEFKAGLTETGSKTASTVGSSTALRTTSTELSTANNALSTDLRGATATEVKMPNFSMATSTKGNMQTITDITEGSKSITEISLPNSDEFNSLGLGKSVSGQVGSKTITLSTGTAEVKGIANPVKFLSIDVRGVVGSETEVEGGAETGTTELATTTGNALKATETKALPDISTITRGQLTEVSTITSKSYAAELNTQLGLASKALGLANTAAGGSGLNILNKGITGLGAGNAEAGGLTISIGKGQVQIERTATASQPVLKTTSGLSTQASTEIGLMNGGVSIGSIGTGLTERSASGVSTQSTKGIQTKGISTGLTESGSLIEVSKGTETQVQVQRTSTGINIGGITIGISTEVSINMPSLNQQTTGLTQQVQRTITVTGLGTTGITGILNRNIYKQIQKQIYKQPTITQPIQIVKPIEVNTSISKTTVLSGLAGLIQINKVAQKQQEKQKIGAVNITKLTSEQIEQQKTQPIQLTSLTTVQTTQQKQVTTTLSTSATTIPSITINPTTPTKVKVPEPLPSFNISVLIPTAYRKAAKQKVSNKEPQFYTLSLVGIASGRAVSKEQANRLAYMGLSRFKIGAKNGKK